MSVQTVSAPAHPSTRPIIAQKDIDPAIRNEFETILSQSIGGDAAARMTEIMHLAELALGPDTAEYIRKLRKDRAKTRNLEEGGMITLELGMMIATHPLTNAVWIISNGPC